MQEIRQIYLIKMQVLQFQGIVLYYSFYYLQSKSPEKLTMLLLQTRYFYANYSLKLEETENSSLIFCPYKNITYICRRLKRMNEYMKQAIFKIMLLLAVIFMRIEVAEAVSYNHISNKIQTSSTISNQTNTDENLNFIHTTLDKAHDLFSTLNQDNYVFNNSLNERVLRNDELNINFALRLLLFYHSLREVGLLKDKECLHPSTNIHCVIPSCEYYVFAMRKIII